MTGSTSSKSLAEQNRSNFEAINTNYAKISKTPPPQDDISITIFILALGYYITHFQGFLITPSS